MWDGLGNIKKSCNCKVTEFLIAVAEVADYVVSGTPVKVVPLNCTWLGF